MDTEERNRYYLEVLKSGEKPAWPRPEADLVVGSQDIGGGLVQHWAYHPDSGRAAEDLPPAEVVASENTTPKPAILVDQPHPEIKGDDEEVLELVLVKDGHAFSHNSSSIKNLQDNINSLLEVAHDQFKIEVEHFMTTDRVSDEVEKKLDSLEERSEEEEVQSSDVSGQSSDESPSVVGDPEETEEQKTDKPDSENRELKTENQEEEAVEEEAPKKEVSNLSDVVEEDVDPIRHVRGAHTVPVSVMTDHHLTPPSRGSKKWVLIPVILLLLMFGGLIYFRETVFTKFAGVVRSEPTPTPIPPAPIPTPTPIPVERSEFRVRVLNGTSKSGAAKELGDILKEKGWEIERVGNNPDQEVAKGYVRAKESAKEALVTLLSDLGSGYEASAEGKLKTTDGADLEVVIGENNR